MKRVKLLVPLLALTAVSCRTSTPIDVIPYWAPTSSATLEQLVAHINEWQSVESLVLRIDLQFVTVEEADEGEGRQFRTAQGRLLLQRPHRIRLNIEAPILSANIAEMASDGERFQLLIHPPDYRAMIQGRNDRTYRDETAKLDDDPELQKAGPLANIRPQHFTDAFLLATIPVDDRQTVVFLEEERVDEPDIRPGAKRRSLVRKSYYVVTTARLGENAPRARYWFGRDGEITLKRQQVYGPEGRLVADIHYSDYLSPEADTRVRIASHVEIERPYDDYTLIVNVKPDGVTMNRDLPDTAFVVTVPEEWGDTIHHIDLDERDRISTP